MMINAHAHAMIEQNDNSENISQFRICWGTPKISPEQYIKQGKRNGIEKMVVLDPPEIVFKLKKFFGDYVIPVPMVDMNSVTPEDIENLFKKGAKGIKFIAPLHSYGDEIYWPLYDVVKEHSMLAVFHTGFLTTKFKLRSSLPREVDITHMRPAALDRVARAFPELKILMAHFGNPWWEEAWKIMTSHKNIYADLSGGTAFRKSLSMWIEIFAPNGITDIQALEKLCFGTDGLAFIEGSYGTIEVLNFYNKLLAAVKASNDLKQKIFRENIFSLTGV